MKETCIANASALLKKNNWNEFAFSEFNVLFKPIAFFSYSVLDSEKKILKTESGAFDAIGFVLRPDIAEYFKKFEKQLANKLPEDIAFEFKKFELSEEELVLKIFSKLSEKEGVLKDFLKLDSCIVAYFPFCFLKAIFFEQNFLFEFSGVGANILNSPNVPLNEKDFFESVFDSVEDLKKAVFLEKTASKKKSESFWAVVFETLLSNAVFKILLFAIAALVVLTFLK